MATANELLADMSTVDKTLIISNDLRTINIPSSVSNIGVEYDDDVLRLEFKMPRYIGDTDLSTFAIRINYINSKGESDAYTVNDAVIGDQHITFSWLVGPTATRYRGNTKFNVCAKTIRADGTVDKEFNTTIATLPVLEGLEVDESIVTEYSDIIEQWKQQLFGIGDTEEASIKAVSLSEQEAIANKGAEVLATIPPDYTTAVKMTDNADRTKSDAIALTKQGESIVVSDSSDDYVRGLKIFGKTTQVVTTGKNLLRNTASVKVAYGVTYTPLPDGSVSIVGTATAGSTYELDFYTPIGYQDEKLILSLGGDASNVNIRLGYFKADNSIVDTLVVVGPTEKEFTYPAEAVSTRTYLTVAADKTYNTVIYPMVRRIGYNATPYESYSGGVASPSPEWPQPFNSIENPTLSIYGGNLLTDYTGYKMTQRGITCEFEGDGVYHIYGTFSGTNPSLQFADINLNIPIDPNAKYTLSGELVDGTLPDDYHPYIGLSSDTVNHRNWMALSIDSRHKVGDVVTSTMIPSDTLNNPTHIDKFWIYAHNDSLEPYTVDFRIRVWLTKSDSPIPYEPYTRQKLTVVNTIKAVPVSQNGNYTDRNGQMWICDEIDFKRGLYIQRVGSITFDGSTDEIWYNELILDNTVMFRIQISDSVNVGNVVGKDYLCSNFPVKNMYNSDVEGTQHTMQQFYFRINKSTLATADMDGFKAYLTAHPITVQYVLAKPIETPLTAEEIEWFRFAHTNCPNTTVVNNAGAMMELTYNADTKTYLDNCSRPTNDQIQSSVDAWLNEHYDEEDYGKSAYEIALDNGFEGTEAEWLESLKGKDGADGKDYYYTTREEVGEIHNNINTAYIWGLYDDLMEDYSDNVQKLVWKPVLNEDTGTEEWMWSSDWKNYEHAEGAFINWQYVISTGEYRTDGTFAQNYGVDTNTKKPKYLILNAIDGQERKTAFSTYRFIRDVLDGNNVPDFFKEGVIIKVIPVCNPSGFDAFTRANDKDVAINRNFDYGYDNGWVQKWYDADGDGKKDDFMNGTSAASEKETQAIVSWLKANEDAELFIDCHNSSYVNEQVVVLGLAGNDVADSAKKIAMRGLDRIIPFWRDRFVESKITALDTPNSAEPKKIIFSNSVSAIADKVSGTAICYALEKLRIPSIAVETATYYGNYSDWKAGLDEERYDDVAYHPESIAMGAEAIGNILLEFYKQAFFGEVSNDMKAISDKIDRALSFHTEGGSVTLTSDIVLGDATAADGGSISIPCTPSGNITITDVISQGSAVSMKIRIPCSNGAKTVDFHADNDTLAAIRTSQGTRYLGSLVGNFFAPNAGQTGTSNTSSSYMTLLTHREDVPQTEKYNYGWMLAAASSSAVNTDGVTFTVPAVKAGTYNWTAYYWND